jgi:hypothetical protein
MNDLAGTPVIEVKKRGEEAWKAMMSAIGTWLLKKEPKQ